MKKIGADEMDNIFRIRIPMLFKKKYKKNSNQELRDRIRTHIVDEIIKEDLGYNRSKG